MLFSKIDLVRYIMRHVGICVEVSEKAFDAATAVAGCGPAFVSFFFFKCLHNVFWHYSSSFQRRIVLCLNISRARNKNVKNVFSY